MYYLNKLFTLFFKETDSFKYFTDISKVLQICDRFCGERKYFSTSYEKVMKHIDTIFFPFETSFEKYPSRREIIIKDER